MAAKVWRGRVGAFTVSVIPEATSMFPVELWPGVSPATWREPEPLDAQGRVAIGSNVMVVEGGAGPVLIDTGMGGPAPWREAFAARFGIVQSAELLPELAALGLPAEAIRHVVISHAHGDHFFGATVARDGRQAPAFPNARYYLGAADWDDFAPRQAPDSAFHLILGALRAEGRLALVAGETAIAPGITLLPTPGESPGHLCVRVDSAGAAAYYIGDLVHHAAEIRHPEWVPAERDAPSLVASRRRIYAAAAASGALVVASHIPAPGAGRIVADGAGWQWLPARPESP